jgi:DNA topoisomerase-6 subunit B
MNFSGVSARASKELCLAAEIDEKTKPKSMNADQIRALLEAFQGERHVKGKPVKLLNPPTNCLSPIEEMLIKKGLSKTIDSRFISTLTRAPAVTQGNPYQVEVGLIFGGNMPADKPVEVLRFANRVPLMYQQGGCLLTKAIESVDWRQYGLDQPGAKGVPKGPAAILVHLASTNVQFTSEAKEALADNGEVIEEARKAMLEMGRGLRKHLEKKKKMAKTKEKFELINDILPAIAEKSAHILGRPVPDLAGSITKIMSAVISETTTTWNKETKQTDVLITLFNYTSRVRAYTILATWPEKAGAEMINNETGGRKEATGVWAWKLPSLEPGERTIIGYSLGGLERGDWTETDVFFRGSQDVIGASKMDEKFLEEIRRQERALSEPGDADSTQEEPAEPMGEPTVAPPTGQTTLFGGDV